MQDYGSFEAVPVSSKQYIVKEVGRTCFCNDSFAQIVETRGTCNAGQSSDDGFLMFDLILGS